MTLEKVKSFNKLAGKYNHNYRKADVLNADPDKEHLNEELVSLNGKTYKEAFEEHTKTLGYGSDKKIRSNAVYAFEVITTFSREDRENVDIEKWKKDNVDWLRKEFNANPKYGDNVLSVVYHGDEEGNVHCHAIVVPIDDKGNLNARYYVRSRQKMIELQDSYGKLMKKEHNLNRGIKNSTARHQDIKRYYASLNATIQRDLPPPKDSECIQEYRQRTNELFKDANLKAMYYENKYENLNLGMKQTIKNEVSHLNKEFFNKYQIKVDAYDELEREYGSIQTVKEKCETYENLIKGISVQDDKEPIVNLVDQLVLTGKNAYEKGKYNSKSIEEK